MTSRLNEVLAEFEKYQPYFHPNQCEWDIVVYVSFNSDTGHYYIGTTTRRSHRRSHHRWELENNRHPNKRFQQAFDRNSNFQWKEVTVESSRHGYDIEKDLILKYRSDPFCLNIMYSVPANRLGCTLSEEHKEALRKANSGKVVSKETKEKTRQALLGRARPSDVVEKVRKSLIGRKLSKEHRAKLSAVRIGKKMPLSQAEKLRAINLGKKHSEETRAKMSAQRQGRKVSEQTKEKIRAAHLGKKMPETVKQKLAQLNVGNKYNLGKKHSDATRERCRQAAIQQWANRKASNSPS